MMDRESVSAGLHGPAGCSARLRDRTSKEPESEVQGRRGVSDSGNRPTMTPRPSRFLRELALVALLFSLLIEARCVSASPRPSFRQRSIAYFAVHRDVLPDVIEAIKLGHVLPGMDRDQVWVVLGEPLQRKPSRASSRIEQWLYPAYRIHQDHFRSQAAFLFKITFTDGRVTGIDPL